MSGDVTTLTISSALVSPQTERPLPPAAITLLWEIAAVLDETHQTAAVDRPVQLVIPAERLRGALSRSPPDGTPNLPARSDNWWLRHCLQRLLGAEIGGEYRDPSTGEVIPWAAVLIAQWEIGDAGSIVRLEIPSHAVRALRTPTTFVQIEAHAAYALPTHARRLYVLLATRKRQRQTHWTYDLPELRELLGVQALTAYRVWGQFQKRVLGPAVQAIQAYGTVDLRYTPIHRGRGGRVVAVRFDWDWSDYSPNSAQSLGEPDPAQTAADSLDAGDAEPAAPGPDIAAARSWWRKADRSTRKFSVIKLGIPYPDSADLHDDSPHMVSAWELLREMEAAPDEDERQRGARAARRRAREEAPGPG